MHFQVVHGALRRRLAGPLLLLIALIATAELPGATLPLAQQESLPVQVENGDMETGDENGIPDRWMFYPPPSDPGYQLSSLSEGAFSGERYTEVDSTSADAGPQTFGNLSQVISAAPFRGKRVRFRAAVKVDSQTPDGQAQLWFRVDLQRKEGEQPTIGFFDNMQNRPIQDAEWAQYEIVGEVADDAERIILGMLVVGNCVASIDDAKLEIVDDDTPVTSAAAAAEANTNDAALSERERLNQIAAEAPTQPFFVWWLVFPATALSLFAVAYAGDGVISRFAFRFSLIYWVLYCFPKLVMAAIPWSASWVMSWYQMQSVDYVVRWTASNVLSIKEDLVSPIGNGSGDTTYAYVQCLVAFVIAMAGALLWSVIFRRRSKQTWLKDLLRSYLRYVLAVTMLGYGLAKLGVSTNQFASPRLERLTGTYGDSSPMGLAWTFMGASRAYTFFAGAGEVLGALLLIWRRTALLGAMVSGAVMLNVVMMNFCYDIPVKQYSVHLFVMAVFIALPDFRQLASVFFRHRTIESLPLAPPYTNKHTIWIQRVIKCYLIVIVIGYPLYTHARNEIGVAPAVPLLGDWRVTQIQIDGEIVKAGSSSDPRLERLTILRDRTDTENGGVVAMYVARPATGIFESGTARIMGKDVSLSAPNSTRTLPAQLTWKREGDSLILSWTRDQAEWTVTLESATRDFLLVNRGFRWINESPYNR